MSSSTSTLDSFLSGYCSTPQIRRLLNDITASTSPKPLFFFPRAFHAPSDIHFPMSFHRAAPYLDHMLLCDETTGFEVEAAIFGSILPYSDALDEFTALSDASCNRLVCDLLTPIFLFFFRLDGPRITRARA